MAFHFSFALLLWHNNMTCYQIKESKSFIIFIVSKQNKIDCRVLRSLERSPSARRWFRLTSKEALGNKFSQITYNLFTPCRHSYPSKILSPHIIVFKNYYTREYDAALINNETDWLKLNDKKIGFLKKNILLIYFHLKCIKLSVYQRFIDILVYIISV